MKIFGFELISHAFHSFSILLLSVLLVLCGKKKIDGQVAPGTPTGKTAVGTQKTLKDLNEPQKSQTNLAKSSTGTSKTDKKGDDDDEDDVQFNLKPNKLEEKKDEFDDDEENPLAKIPCKPRNKKNHVPHAPGKPCPGGPNVVGKTGAAQQQANAKTIMKTEEEQNVERPLLGPNEKQIGVSCYQFEPSGQPAAAKKNPRNVKPEQPRPPPAAAAPSVAPRTVAPVTLLPSAETQNNRSTLSMNLRKTCTKTQEVEPETASTLNKEQLEKTQN
ncbi:unnamed protein product [Caenorhabditis sp. 36 PRJEB53466]|nr:unnamed protein product [Caenorhabditis sp. 36 PRJEB53466]